MSRARRSMQCLLLTLLAIGLVGNAPLRGKDAPVKTFDERVRDLQASGLEVVIVFDSTATMAGVLGKMKTSISQLALSIAYLVPNARIGLVTYRDNKKYDARDYEYTVKFIRLQKTDEEGRKTLKDFLRRLEAVGGGDIPEAVMDGVQAAVDRAGWSRGPRKVIIVVGDAPPHPEDNGIPKILALCKKWKTSGGVLSCVDTTGGGKVVDEFTKMAEAGGGEAKSLKSVDELIRRLAVLAFGSQYEKDVEKVVDAVVKHENDAAK